MQKYACTAEISTKVSSTIEERVNVASRWAQENVVKIVLTDTNWHPCQV